MRTMCFCTRALAQSAARHAIACALATGAIFVAAAQPADRLRVVAAENFYADLARQIGGPGVQVTSVLSNPDQDPHLFEANASVARAIAEARLVVYNGAGYDPWVERLLGASSNAERRTIVVAALVHRAAGDNPHLWYDPHTMPELAMRVAAVLSDLDPGRKAMYAERLKTFDASLAPLREKIAQLRRAYFGAEVTATEPVFGYMAAALGLRMRNAAFQRAIMNGTEPSVSEIAAFEHDLRARTVRVLLYNSQTSQPLTARMRAIAAAAGVPVVGVTETEPPRTTYQEWMLSQLDALGRALATR